MAKRESPKHIIKEIKASEILDSRGKPTVSVEITLESGSGSAAVPSGASTGIYEALELRDSDGKVSQAISNVNIQIRNALLNKKFNQKTLDRAMIKLDGTKNKSKMGANSILGVSLAFSHAAANVEGIPLYKYFNNISGGKNKLCLPVPMLNILNGGRHAKNGLDIQEFIIMPIGANSFREALENGKKVFNSLGNILKSRGLETNLGDEGGYAPILESDESAFKLIIDSIKSSGLVPGKDISLAIDAASSEFFREGKYNLKKDNKSLTTEEMISFYSDIVNKYKLISIEDPLEQDSWKGYSQMTKTLGKKIQIVGDDLFVTNPIRIKKGIKIKAANAILIKLNQIGTVSETIEVIQLAKEAGYSSIVSHRSGETLDTTIADLCVGLGVTQIKSGAPYAKERAAKYQRLLEIEKELGKKAKYSRLR